MKLVDLIKKTKRMGAVLLATALLCVSGCGNDAENTVEQEQISTEENRKDTEKEVAPQEQTETDSKVASADEMVTPEDVVEDWMTPITGDALIDGTYDITVDSSSSMFRIASATLTVTDGQMSASMTMGGTGYLYLYMGTGEKASVASEDAYISYEEDATGASVFTAPVEALDDGISCAAFSKKKEKWYDRTLVFRADSLPTEAFKDGAPNKGDTVSDLGLSDGDYEAEVSLEGGSGKASVASPAKITVKDGVAYATIVWSSNNYDYMMVDGVKYEPVAGGPSTEEGSAFEIPVSAFNAKLSVTADTLAMSTPHEISYTLLFQLQQ